MWHLVTRKNETANFQSTPQTKNNGWFWVILVDVSNVWKWSFHINFLWYQTYVFFVANTTTDNGDKLKQNQVLVHVMLAQQFIE